MLTFTGSIVNRRIRIVGLNPSRNLVPVLAWSISNDVCRNFDLVGSAILCSSGRLKHDHESHTRMFCRRTDDHGAWLNLLVVSIEGEGEDMTSPRPHSLSELHGSHVGLVQHHRVLRLLHGALLVPYSLFHPGILPHLSPSSEPLPATSFFNCRCNHLPLLQCYRARPLYPPSPRMMHLHLRKKPSHTRTLGQNE